MDEVVVHARNLAFMCKWFVFPCREDKRPACPHGFKDAVSDPNDIVDLWQRYPGPLIGIATGAMSGIDVLDLDLKHEAALQWWRVNETRMPLTRTFRTRSGGLHVYFVHATGIGCTAGKLGESIDTRGDGGYVIGWFAAGYECLDHTRAVRWPDWLLTQLLPKPKPPLARTRASSHDQSGRAIDGVLRIVTAAPEGQRNAVLHWGACRLQERVRTGEIGASEAEALLVAAATVAGLTEQEARATARSGLGRTA